MRAKTVGHVALELEVLAARRASGNHGLCVRQQPPQPQGATSQCTPSRPGAFDVEVDDPADSLRTAEQLGAMTDRDHVGGKPLPTISDDHMRERLGGTKQYILVLLRKTEKLVRPGIDQTIWEHGRRNFALREHGSLPIVMPVDDDGDWAGIGIFTGSLEQVKQIMDHDPGVQAGIFTYEAHAARGFPGSNLPG